MHSFFALQERILIGNMNHNIFPDFQQKYIELLYFNNNIWYTFAWIL